MRMSQADEEALANHIARLSRWIAESESLRARTTDEETLQLIDADLARWRESIKQGASTFRQPTRNSKWLEIIVSSSLVIFWISFGLMCLLSPLALRSEQIQAVLVPFAFLFTFGAGAVCMVALAVRGAVARRWRYNLRSILIVMTAVAVILGLWFWAVRS
jgi:hypothetical protein